MNQLLNGLQIQHQLSAECRDYLVPLIKTESITLKDQALLIPGQICRRLLYLKKGSAMQYIYLNDGERTAFRFWQEGEIIADFLSFSKQAPSDDCIEIQEPCTLLTITYKQLAEALRLFPEMAKLYFLLTIKYSAFTEQRNADLLTLNTRERYEKLLNTYPGILDKASQNDVAGLLNISRRTLTRLIAGE